MESVYSTEPYPIFFPTIITSIQRSFFSSKVHHRQYPCWGQGNMSHLYWQHHCHHYRYPREYILHWSSNAYRLPNIYRPPSQHDPVPWTNTISKSKLKAEGTIDEVNIILGWNSAVSSSASQTRNTSPDQNTLIFWIKAWYKMLSIPSSTTWTMSPISYLHHTYIMIFPELHTPTKIFIEVPPSNFHPYLA